MIIIHYCIADRPFGWRDSAGPWESITLMRCGSCVTSSVHEPEPYCRKQDLTTGSIIDGSDVIPIFSGYCKPQTL